MIAYLVNQHFQFHFKNALSKTVLNVAGKSTRLLFCDKFCVQNLFKGAKHLAFLSKVQILSLNC